ncbi:MAG: tetratricopeptide repeat protein [Nitrospirota bacterium]
MSRAVPDTVAIRDGASGGRAETLTSAARAYRAGRIEEAETWCRNLLRASPDDPYALHLNGLLAHCRGANSDGGAGPALPLPLAAIEASFYAGLGSLLYGQGRWDAAIDLLGWARDLAPTVADIQYRLGAALKSGGRSAEAEACFRALLTQWPEHVKAHYSLGNTLRAQGRWDEAAACFRAAIRLKPEFAQAHYSLGNVLRAQGRSDAAVAAYGDALRLNPEFPEAHNNVGNLLRDLGRYDEAMASYRRALAIVPELAEAHNNLGLALQELGEVDEALPCFARALAANPSFAEAYNNRGNAYKDAGEIDGALADYREAIRLAPGFVEAHSNLVYTLNYHPAVSSEELFAEHRRWAATHAGLAVIAPSDRTDRTPDRRLRIGYLSPDFRRHPVACFLAPILSYHNRTDVEVTCYADVGATDAVTERLRGLSGSWRDICGRSDGEVADLIRSDHIDILVDLAGHTRKNRLLVLAQKPAPIQATYLGYPNTTGLNTVDYRLTDAIADPPGQEAYYSEALVRLPNGFACYEPDHDAPPVSASPAGSRGAVTFGSLNDLAKLNDEVIALWCRVLDATPSSRLLVFRNTLKGAVQERYRAAFVARGIDPSRVDLFNTRSVGASFLSVYHQIDVALDAFPWNGHTTTCEALWMGVPVVTLLGARHAGRMSASLVSRVGLADLVAGDSDAYVRIATAWARDPGRLAAVRSELRGRMAASPLCGGAAFTRALEEAYRTMWRRYCDTARVRQAVAA